MTKYFKIFLYNKKILILSRHLNLMFHFGLLTLNQTILLMKNYLKLFGNLFFFSCKEELGKATWFKNAKRSP